MVKIQPTETRKTKNLKHWPIIHLEMKTKRKTDL